MSLLLALLPCVTKDATGQIGTTDKTDVDRSLELGVKYLFARQSKDGSWKSEYYGNLKQGAGISSLVLFSLSHVDSRLLSNNKTQIRNAFQFLKRGIAKHGYVANPSGPDYSNYATALTLLASRSFETKWKERLLTREEERKLVDFLVRSQVDETHGMKPGDDDFGGWDLSGWMQEPRLSPGTNISISSFVLLALKDERGDEVELVRERARTWVKRLKNADHGFHFHPKKDHSGNKAEWEKGNPLYPRSYGTATVDGIRMLRSLKAGDKEISKSAGWLVKNTPTKKSFQFVPGFKNEDRTENSALGNSQSELNDQQPKDPQPKNQQPNDPDIQSWEKGLMFYYLMGLALEQKSLPKEFQKRCQAEIPPSLAAMQLPGGQWENPSARMREDDPLIATPFAIIALALFSGGNNR